MQYSRPDSRIAASALPGSRARQVDEAPHPEGPRHARGHLGAAAVDLLVAAPAGRILDGVVGELDGLDDDIGPRERPSQAHRVAGERLDQLDPIVEGSPVGGGIAGRDDHVLAIAAAQKPIDDGTPDEARPACYDDAHSASVSPPPRSGCLGWWGKRELSAFDHSCDG